MRSSWQNLANLDFNVMEKLSLLCSILFLAIVLSVIFQNPRMFTKKHGITHAINGFIYLIWILIGFYDITFQLNSNTVTYLINDIVLGIAGTLLPLTAAYEFQHRHVKNVASGTLDEHATVTYNEMIEHSFYQFLNLLQIIYIHSYSYIPNINLWYRIAASLLITSPWLIRHHFPIHKFSDNYIKIDQKSSNLVRFLYRIKKYQYIFYKHFLLHGLNISLACYTLPMFMTHNSSSDLHAIKISTIANFNASASNAVSVDVSTFGSNRLFRLYWLLLNTSYVMEFFLQTLVKKKYLLQSTMLCLQQLLMFASTLAAIFVLGHVKLSIALLSCVMNLVNRKFDFLNMCIIYGLIMTWQKYVMNANWLTG